MYTLSEVFLSWAAWVRRAFASSFSGFLASREGVPGSGVIGLPSGRLNVTDFVGCIGGSVVGLALPSSDLSESYKVSSFIESSSWGRYGVDFGFRNRFKTSTSLFIGWTM